MLLVCHWNIHSHNNRLLTFAYYLKMAVEKIWRKKYKKIHRSINLLKGINFSHLEILKNNKKLPNGSKWWVARGET